LATPSTPLIARGGMPRPVQAPPIGRVRRGDVRIGAVIDVEHRALRAFDQHALPLRIAWSSASDTSPVQRRMRAPNASSWS
jgi:hypothetical protein